MIGVDLGTLAWLIPTLAAGGVATGLLAGLFGIGGGGVLVPILYELFGIIGVDEALRIHLSVGTALAVVIPTSIRSFLGHRRRGAVDMKLLRRWVPWLLVGVAAGTLIAAYSPSEVLRAVFAVMCCVMGVRMIAMRDSWRLGDEVPGNPLAAILAVLIGILAVLLGVAGGAYLTTIMVLYGRSIIQAVATAAGLGAIVALPAALGYVWSGWGIAGLPPGSLGFVNLLAVAMVIPTSVLAAPLGVRLAHGLSRRTLERAFGVFLLVIAARFALSLVI